MQAITSWFANHWDFILQILKCIGIFLVFYIIGKIVKHQIFARLAKHFTPAGTKTTSGKAIIFNGFKTPVGLLFTIIGAYIAFINLPFSQSISAVIFPIALKLLRVGIILLVTVGLMNTADVSKLLIKKVSSKLDKQTDKTITRFLSRIFKALIGIFATVIIISELGYDINGLIAGLGLGGLTFALAAQDSASNFFGGLVIIFDKPFSIGDWIVSTHAEGIVEDVNFRCTKIRTFTDRLVVVPNSKLANDAITNCTKMNMRQVKFNIGVTYNTNRQKINDLVCDIRALLENTDNIVKTNFEVRLSEFNQSSIDVLIVYYTIPTDYDGYLAVKEQINFEILSLMEKHEISFAFPTQSIYIEKQ